MGLIKQLFEQGEYSQVLEKTYENTSKIDLSSAPYVIGSLSFLGRNQEAEAFYTNHRSKLSASQQAYAHFFLSLVLIRRSQYKKAKSYLLLNKTLLKKTKSADPEIKFLVDQGISFFLFFIGQYEKSTTWNQKSLTSAIELQDFWMKALAYDLLANNLIYSGHIHEGLKYFTEAIKFAQKLKNKALVKAIETSDLIAHCEYGIDLKNSVAKLENKLETLHHTDSFSRANLGLEHARQLTLQGRWPEALAILEDIAPLIYQSKNRRQEVRLNLRWAEISYLKNEASSCLHYLRSGQLCLEFVDQTFELQLLGLQIKVFEKLKNTPPPEAVHLRFVELSQQFKTIKNLHILSREKNSHPQKKLISDDQIHQRLLQAAEGPGQAKKVILETHYFSWLYRFFDLQKGENYILLNFEPKSITCISNKEITHLPGELSTLVYKILTTLKKTVTSKEELVQEVWGYQYDPLRHDSLIYSSFSMLRKILGKHADQLETSELGYSLNVTVMNMLEQIPSIQIITTEDDLKKNLSHSLEQGLNARQIQIMQYLERNQFIAVKNATKLFNITEITANRDLRSLFEKQFVIRIGQGRATQYTKRRSL